MSKRIEKQNKLKPGPGINMGGVLGTDIWVDESYIASIVGNSGNVITKSNLIGGTGIITHDYGNDINVCIDEYFIDDRIDKKISSVNKTKPIFIMGLPNSFDAETLNKHADALHKRMSEYHVLVIKNKTDDYSAKIYSVEGITPVGIDEIKKYIDFKTKK